MNTTSLLTIQEVLPTLQCQGSQRHRTVVEGEPRPSTTNCSQSSGHCDMWWGSEQQLPLLFFVLPVHVFMFWLLLVACFWDVVRKVMKNCQEKSKGAISHPMKDVGFKHGEASNLDFWWDIHLASLGNEPPTVRREMSHGPGVLNDPTEAPTAEWWSYGPYEKPERSCWKDLIPLLIKLYLGSNINRRHPNWIHVFAGSMTTLIWCIYIYIPWPSATLKKNVFVQPLFFVL